MAKRTTVLFGVLAVAALLAGGAWLAGSRIESPADAAARTAPPAPSPILVPVEQRVLSSSIVTRGKARFGLPQPISIAPSSLKPTPGLIANLPLRSTQLKEGDVILTASGRPVFILQGGVRAYRDLVPGISGDDVRQLEQALQRLGFHPGRVDGHYDRQTSAAVGRWYKSRGWEPFGPTREQLANLATLERDWGEAGKNRLAAETAVAAATLTVDAARAAAAHNNGVAVGELDAKLAEFLKMRGPAANGVALALETERAKAEHAKRTAEAEVAALVAERALVVFDPRQTETARASATAKLEVARAAASRTRLEGKMAVLTAENELGLAAERVVLAQDAVQSVGLDGQKAVQAAVDAGKLAAFDVRIASDRFARLDAELAQAKARLGIQVPVDEIVFTSEFPARVEEVTAAPGAAATGPIMSLTNNQLVIDTAVPLEAAPLVKPGMAVAIDEQALGVSAAGVVATVANTPGTRGVDGYHVYCEVRVLGSSNRLEGSSLRLTLPIESTRGAVTAVPLSALSLAADGTSRIQVATGGALRYVAVKPGLAADGYVAVTPVNGALAPGQLVVVGYNTPQGRAQ
jgi:peptidoglycan hydrolase-like protein with peptidoglycan-binding domain